MHDTMSSSHRIGLCLRLALASTFGCRTSGAPANSTSTLRFVCDPIGGNRMPVSEEIDVSPGDQLVMIVNPGG